MKRGEPPKRKTPLQAKTGLRRATPFQQKAGREQPGARTAAPKRRQVDVGPTADVVDAVVERERHSCLICGYGVGPNERGRRWSIHHRLRRSQGVDHSIFNLILLCGGSEVEGCHQEVHRNIDAARAGGWLLQGRQHPLAVPVLIPLEDRRVYLGADGLYRDVREAS